MKEIENQSENIDEQGNVLYLDSNRLNRKEVGFPRYKNKSNGLGIFNWLMEHVIYIDDKRMPIINKLYHVFIRLSALMKKGDWRAHLYKSFIKLAPDMKRHTGTVVLPLNVDVSGQGEKTVVPIDIIKESLKKVSYIVGMDSCLCRESNDCKDYPHEIGCLFLGEASKVVEKHNLGRRFTYEEACERIDKAVEVGLRARLYGSRSSKCCGA